MKRIHSIDEVQSIETNKKFASNSAVISTIKLDNGQGNATSFTNSKMPHLSRSSSIVMLSSDDEEIVPICETKPKRKPISLNESFIILKKSFPNVTEGLLLERLNQTKNKKNFLESLDNAIKYFASFQTDEAVNDVLVIENEALTLHESEPTTSAAVAANAAIKTENSKSSAAAGQLSTEIAFIQSLFPNIDDQLAAEILQNVDNNNNNNNAEARESQIVDYIIDNKLNELTTTSTGISVEDYNLDKDLKSVQNIIEDCDPTYILDKLKVMSNNPRRVELIIADLIEKKSYPKMKEYLNKIKKQREIDAHLNTPLNIDEFLKIYPEPFSRFYQNDKEMSESYKAHCRTELFNRFDFIAEDSILEVLVKHKYHLTPAYRQLEKAILFKETELKQRAQTNLKSSLAKKKVTLETATKQQIMTMPKSKKIFKRL